MDQEPTSRCTTAGSGTSDGVLRNTRYRTDLLKDLIVVTVKLRDLNPETKE